MLSGVRRTLGQLGDLTLARDPFGDIHNTKAKIMNNDTLSPESEAPIAPEATPEAATSKPSGKAKAQGGKGQRAGKASQASTDGGDGETGDRLPTSVKELKETKGGLVASLYLAGRSRDFIAKELKLAFKVSEAQSVKITRRIVGRVRLYQRIFELVPLKK